MLDAVVDLFPEVRVGYLGLERDEATFQPSEYYAKLPRLERRLGLRAGPDAGDRRLGGGRAEQVKEAGARRSDGLGGLGPRRREGAARPRIPMSTSRPRRSIGS